MPDPSPFSHGVASGDPTGEGVVIWTRVSTDADSSPVSWTVARDPELRDAVASGEAVASAGTDHTVSVDVGGLEPGEIYFYGFSVDGERSEVGRTWTLRADPERVRFATCSCAKYNAGFFNAYARLAEREDLDFLLHLGDYIYEAGNVPAKGQTPGADIGRPFEPLGECRTLDEYRQRYSQYHRDQDVRAMHRALPMIPMLDDHELADGAWAGGSDAHDPGEHGPWSERRAAAFRARAEWLPLRPPDPADPTRVFRRIKLGGLADLYLLDIRSRRDRPTVGPEMDDPGRSMLGTEQREWLLSELENAGEGWTLVVTPSVMARTWCDPPSETLRTALLKLKLMDEDGEGPDEDQWDGYPAERRLLIDRFASIDDLLVLSADLHISMAARITDDDGRCVAVELTASSLTSQNLDDKLGVEPRSEQILASERALMETLDDVEWCELAGHGYMVCELRPDRARAEWWLVDGVLEPSDGESCVAAFEVKRGRAALATSALPAAAETAAGAGRRDR